MMQGQIVCVYVYIIMKIFKILRLKLESGEQSIYK